MKAHSQNQKVLRDAGLYRGEIDGIWGPLSRRAWEQAGEIGDFFLNPLTSEELPWIAEGYKVNGLHEIRDNAALREWLRSDRHALGDPAKFPWCGDFVETAIRLTLKDEPIPDNPYWARNWTRFGQPTEPVYGAIAVFSRAGGGGHVAFLVGASQSHIYCLGGNQNNAVNVAPFLRRTVLAYRWPSTFKNPNMPLPSLSGGDLATLV